MSSSDPESDVDMSPHENDSSQEVSSSQHQDNANDNDEGLGVHNDDHDFTVSAPQQLNNIDTISLLLASNPTIRQQQQALEALSDLLRTSIAPSPFREPNNTEACLGAMPGEILRHIMKYLLLNHELGEPTSMQRDHDYGRNYKYELHPQILRVGKKMKDIGYEVLYGLNTFYHVCPDFIGTRFPRSCHMSPILRYFYGRDHDGQGNSIQDVASYKLVKKWKIVLNTSYLSNQADGSNSDDSDDDSSHMNVPVSATFIDFCRALYVAEEVAPRTVEVLILPKNIEARYAGSLQYKSISGMMLGSSLLSCTELSFKDAEIFEIPNWIRYDIDNIDFTTAFLETEKESLYLVNLTEKTALRAPVEAAFRLYQNLRKYAQSFELFLPFWDDMDRERSDNRQSTRIENYLDDKLNSMRGKEVQALKVSSHLSEGFRMARLQRGLELSHISNPFKTSGDRDQWHPVERILTRCREGSEMEDLSVFKDVRKELLPLLEEQYQQICRSFANLNQSVKEQKGRGGVFDSDCYIRHSNAHVYHGPP